ncbi:MAG: hypothetical protein AAF216_03490 [Pseudomonadota bacterium]
MRSLVLTALALGWAFTAPTAVAEPGQRFALAIEIEETGEVISLPEVVVEAGTPYTMPVDGRADYQLRLTIAKNTRQAGLEYFDRDLGASAASFIFVETELVQMVSGENGAPDWQILSDSDVLLGLSGRWLSVEASLSGEDNRRIHMAAVPFRSGR